MGDRREGPLVRRQMSPDGCWQLGHAGLTAERGRRRSLLGIVFGICRLARFQGDGIRGQGTALQGRCEPRDELIVQQMAAEQEDLDQGPGALAFAVCFDRGCSPGVVDRREPADSPGLIEGCGTGLADQGFQAVVEIEAGFVAGDKPLVPGNLLAAVVDHQLGGVEHDADSAPDQPDRDRVAVHPDADLAVAVDSWCRQPACLERFFRQRRQERLLGREVLTDRVRAGADPAGVILLVPPVDHLVEFGEGGHFGDGDQVVAAEPADLALDSALLMGAADAGLAVERIQAVVGAEGSPAFGFDAAA